MRNLWCLEKISILPLVISATGIVPQSLFKNLKILDLDNTLVVEIQKGILLYRCPKNGVLTTKGILLYRCPKNGVLTIYYRIEDVEMYTKKIWKTFFRQKN
jgi:hypothetical protein